MLENVALTIPKEPGSYLLWLHNPHPLDLTVGRLGRFSFPIGDYVYMGSAHGSGGLRARLMRHLHGGNKLHWHIDRLRAMTQVRGFAYKIYETNLSGNKECYWSKKLGALPEASVPAPGFGASDCRSGCQSHLVLFPGDSQQTPVMIADQIGVHLRII